jgi:hypothetical protein
MRGEEDSSAASRRAKALSRFQTLKPPTAYLPSFALFNNSRVWTNTSSPKRT